MSYRRRAKEEREWQDWLKVNVELIAAAGLPEAVLIEEEHWGDFVDHCFLDHHPDPLGFDANQLSVCQKAALLRLLLNWKADATTTVLGAYLVYALLDAVEQAYNY